MATAIKQDIAGETQRMHEVLAAQKASFTAAMPESLAVRTAVSYTHLTLPTKLEV